ncbi:MAG: imidazole glycerol phosphate synthase subunit HisH [Bacteroidaceae bacterium]|nr:imidazole glycerol phosphate synthase subunit HisH [Prevotellaceae bacterium]MDY2850282.1 imidazole glycerol phosphate synthase subunit HisH [Bacteroidaceae bacterium]
MNVVIIKYNAGNVCSVINALHRLGVSPTVTDNSELIRKADCVLFPGQGEASYTMRYLREKGLDEVICSLTQPVLGICIGMQLMCRHSEEGDTDCLGIFDVGAKRFVPTEHQFKIPHMGWNSIGNLKSPLFKGIDNGEFVYFIHSYYIPDNDNSIAECNYIHSFCASLNKDNFYATQFHPEKSGSVGERIIENFLSISRI